MMFLINAQDTAGNVTLNRASVPAALKKAGELISDGCWNVEIVTPDGATYQPGEFDQLRESAATAGADASLTALAKPSMSALGRKL
jgi:hypothetical protein